MVVGVHVRDEDGRDLGQDVVHVLSVVSAELPERPLATVQQHRATRAAGGRQKTRGNHERGKKNTSCLSKMLTEIDFCVQTNDTHHYLLKAFESFVLKHGSLDLFISAGLRVYQLLLFWVKHSSNLKFRILVKMSTFQ